MQPSPHLRTQQDNYTVKKIETVISTPLIRARVFTLAPQEGIPWHYHNEITDHYFVLRGTLIVETRPPETEKVLGIGERYQVKSGVAHHLSNRGPVDCEFLLLQGTGSYDWISVHG
jgi:quercetin dioxygenase-like cupin family protein